MFHSAPQTASRYWKAALCAAAAALLIEVSFAGNILPSLWSAASPSFGEMHPASRVTTKVVKKGGTRPAAIDTVKKGPYLAIVDHPDIQDRHKAIATDLLNSLPAACRTHLRSFYVNYDPKPKNRGLGGESSILVTGIVPDDEFRALIVHECGHVIDLGELRGTPTGGKASFFDGPQPIYSNDPSRAFYAISWTNSKTKKMSARPEDFVSGYAKSDPFEDVAESFAYYVLQHEDFARLAKKNKVLQAKFDWITENIFGGQEPILASGKFSRTDKQPWDVTKLPYVWVN